MNIFKFIFIGFFILSFINTDSFANNTENNKNTAASTAPSSPPAPSSTNEKKPDRLWNLQDADILSVINEVSQETGKNFIVDPRVTGKITLVSSKPIPQKELYQVFLSVIGTIGYSAVSTGNVIKIVPNNETSEQLEKRKHKLAAGEEVTIRVIPLESIQASQLIPALRPLLPQWSSISSYAPGNILVLVGRANNLDRIAEIVNEVDHSFSGGIEVVPLKYASATQVVTVLSNLQNAGRGSDPSVVSLAADERSNSVLLNGARQARLKMRVLIAQLDSPIATASGNTEVIYLKYLQAKEFAPILSKVSQNMLGKDSGKSDSASSGGIINTAAIATGNAAAQANRENTSPTNIQAELNTNAIIITAPPTMMRALKIIVSKLDIRPAQVLVEAVIAQLDENQINNLGITWGGTSTDGSRFGAGYAALGPNSIGIIPRTNIRAVLSALENLNGTEILSTPSIMVLDNQKAVIAVGQDVPYQNGSYASTTGSAASSTTATPYNTFSSKPVTLQLDVTPQINLGDSIRMAIKLKNDTLQNRDAVLANPGTVQPLINTSKIENKVLVNSEDVLVLGGLISNQNGETLVKVPILSEIPVAGLLFRNKSKNFTKKNLIIFIKPSIMRTSQDSNAVTEAKYMLAQKQHANFSDHLQELGKHQIKSHLPPWKNRRDLPEPFKE